MQTAVKPDRRRRRRRRKMAAPMGRVLVSVQRTACYRIKTAEVCAGAWRCGLAPVLVPVRTKKRFFVPPVSLRLNPQNPRLDPGARARAAGVVVPREPLERPINISCTAGVFDPYVPPEGDGRLSSLSREGLRQRAQHAKQTAASQLALRKIREHDPDFSTKDFAARAQEIFIQAHLALTDFNKEKLHSLVTERCYPEMTRGNRYKTLRWTFLESLEPPRVVHARCPDMVSNSNLYGQVTLRMHSKQTLAVYDRFGRLMLGSEQDPRDVLEYVVMERHLVNPYGRWRLHAKIIPAWAPPKDPVLKTVVIRAPRLRAGETEAPKPQPVQWNK